jgi:hypothetical protein
VAEGASGRGEVMYVPNRNTNAECFEDKGAIFSALTRNGSYDAYYAVSENLIFAMNYLNDIPHREKNLLWQGAANFLCVRSSLLELVTVTELQAAEA